MPQVPGSIFMTHPQTLAFPLHRFRPRDRPGPVYSTTAAHMLLLVHTSLELRYILSQLESTSQLSSEVSIGLWEWPSKHFKLKLPKRGKRGGSKHRSYSSRKNTAYTKDNH
jgi:hypothetical protein